MFHQPMRNQASRSEGNMKWASDCPICGTAYNPIEARVVAEKEGAFLLHTNCKKCGSSVVATLIASPMGISSIGLVTDLTYNDVIKFKDSGKIEVNDVLDVYKFLSDFRGNWKEIIK
jgi:hypothetical protein